MKKQDIPSKKVASLSVPHPGWLLDLLFLGAVVSIPNLFMALQVSNHIHQPEYLGQHVIDALSAMDSYFYIVWVTINVSLLGLILGLRTYLLHPLRRIMHQLHTVRTAYSPENHPTMSIRLAAMEMGRFTAFAVEYYRKHQEVSYQLEEARAIIAQFSQQQETLLKSTGREIGDQYRSVLAYANYLEEHILNNKLDPSLRYDFDDVCESSFNLKLIAGALTMLSSPTPPREAVVPLAALMQQTMLALAPALDRRSMRLTTAEVDSSVAAQGDPGFIAHILWMMLLGMIRYAADESLLRIRCLHNREGTEALLSIVVNELQPSTSRAQDESYMIRQLQHLTPPMFAETIRIHGNVQLADLLIKRMGGHISVLPLTTASCEICMTLPAAIITSMAD